MSCAAVSGSIEKSVTGLPKASANSCVTFCTAAGLSSLGLSVAAELFSSGLSVIEENHLRWRSRELPTH
jgi:hypothetical protein